MYVGLGSPNKKNSAAVTSYENTHAHNIVMSVSIYVSLTAADLNVRSIVHLHYYNVIIT